MKQDTVWEKIAAHRREGLEFRVRTFSEIADAADIRAAKLRAQAEAILSEAKTEDDFSAQYRAAAAAAAAKLTP